MDEKIQSHNIERLRAMLPFAVILNVFMTIIAFVVDDMAAVKLNNVVFLFLHICVYGFFVVIPHTVRKKYSSIDKIVLQGYILVTLLWGMTMLGYKPNSIVAISDFIGVVIVLNILIVLPWKRMIIIYGFAMFYLFYLTPFLRISEDDPVLMTAFVVFFLLLAFYLSQILYIKTKKNNEMSQRLIDHQNTLEALVFEKTKANETLEKAIILSEEARIAKSNFLAIMSHEIRTPINAIIGFNHLVSKTQLSELQRNYVDKTNLSAQNLIGLVNDILDFSKIEANKITLENKIFDLYEIINNVSSIISMDLYEKKLKLCFNLDHDLPYRLVGDASRLSQVLLNLINNAIKYSNHGEIVVNLSLESKDAHHIWLKFVIEDRGIGISREQQEKLFNAFYQADMSTTRKNQGTGLGLAISKNLIDLMGGTIYVKSELGEGSQFVFTARFEYEQEFMKEDIERTLLSSLKVLLVCNNQSMASIMASIFTELDVNIQLFNPISMARSISPLDNNDYDLLLIDWKLFVIDEIQSKCQKRAPYTMIISDSREYELEALEGSKQVDGIIYYPIGKEQLYQKLNRKNENNEPKIVKRDPLENRKILLVEDNEINQELSKAILEEYGMIIHIAENGAMALNMVMEDKYDLILMDLQMPIMDGFEATIRIREMDEFQDIPIIAMSAHAIKGIKEQVKEAGMNDYISKPFEISKMIATLRQWL